MWNPLNKLKEKITGTPAAPDEKPTDGQKAAEEAGFGGLEKSGLMPQFFRHWKNPKFLRQLRTIVGKMQAEGINIKDKTAVETWLKSHQAEIESGKFAEEAEAAKPATFVKTAPDVGRNEPCKCGSGRKFKKCCGAK